MKNEKTETKELDPKKTEVLDKMAHFIVQRDLDVIAVFTIESFRPLHFLGSQALLFFEPFLNILVQQEKISLFREAMEEERYLDYFLEKIESESSKDKK